MNNTNNSGTQVTAIILAAGKGTRMKSPLPKVLHPVAGKPMIIKVIETVKAAQIQDIRLVIGHGSQLVKAVVESTGVGIFTQAEQLGTADAVKSAKIDDIEGLVLILNGDHPLIEPDDIKNLIRTFKDEKLDLAVVSADVAEPGSLGRIVRSGGVLHSIVEAKDASSEALKIHEVNTGMYLLKADILREYLPQIKNQNTQKEFYLTDIVELCREDQCKVDAIKLKSHVAHGVNSQAELAQATKILFQRKINQLMTEGVLVINPDVTYIEDFVQIGQGSVLFPNVYIKGKTKIGSCSVIESNCMIIDSVIGDSVEIKANTYIEKSILENRVSAGPFARIRPESHLEEESHVGNFVELKKVKFGKKAKAGHLTYLGDAEIGEGTNIGCGTITCNYAVDKKKYKTKIGKNVFVGSDSQFIAPVEIGDGAIIGSGSTITKNVPADALAVARGKQFVKEGYALKLKENKES